MTRAAEVDTETVEAVPRYRTAAAVGIPERPASLRAVLACPAVAAAATVGALIATHAAGVRFRDPDNVAAGYVAMVGAGVVVLVGLDVLLRATRRAGVFPPPRAELHRVRRMRWSRRRATAVGVA